MQFCLLFFYNPLCFGIWKFHNFYSLADFTTGSRREKAILSFCATLPLRRVLSVPPSVAPVTAETLAIFRAFDRLRYV